MEMNLLTVNSILVSLFREIENPLPSPTGSTFWCYMDYPREDVTVPRISVSQVSCTESQIGVGDIIPPSSGTFGVLMTATYDIDVWVKQGTTVTAPDSWGYGTGKKVSGTQLRDMIGDLVIKKVLNKRQWMFDNYSIIDFQVTGVITQPFVDEFEWLRKTITIQLSWVQSHS